jgi:hypothetical protein
VIASFGHQRADAMNEKLIASTAKSTNLHHFRALPRLPDGVAVRH